LFLHWWPVADPTTDLYLRGFCPIKREEKRVSMP
jgi:hypothetical protein